MSLFYSCSFSCGGMYAVSSIITAIAGRLTTEKQVNKVSNIFYGRA
jgi:predicted double-glycine peptidase